MRAARGPRGDGWSEPMRNRVLQLLALLLSVAVHFVLAYSIRIDAHQPVALTTETGPECVMAGNGGIQHQWERELKVWSLMQDPTIMTLPNYELGFSSVLDDAGPLPCLPVPPYELAVALAAEKPVKKLTLAVTTPSLIEAIRATWPRREPDAEAVTAAELPKTLIWRTMDGQVIEAPPPVAAKALSEALTQGTPVRPTRIAITRLGTLASPRLQASCGVARLDQLALAMIGSRLSKLEGRAETDASAGPDPFFPAIGGRRVVEVEWRTAAPVTEAEDGGGQP